VDTDDGADLILGRGGDAGIAQFTRPSSYPNPFGCRARFATFIGDTERVNDFATRVDLSLSSSAFMRHPSFPVG
jgi:hypothetical protein